MRFTYAMAIACIFFAGCDSAIKNPNPQVVEEPGTEISETADLETEEEEDYVIQGPLFDDVTEADLTGFYVGYFMPDREKLNGEENLYVDEGYVWRRENKINISIDRFEGDSIYGHSVVAGNDRPFKGTFTRNDETEQYVFSVREPGDDRYDGAFEFAIEGSGMAGTWAAYQDLTVKYRKYELERQGYLYDADVMLEHAKQYINWQKSIEQTDSIEYEEGEFEEYVLKEFSTSTDRIYEINASNTVLTQEIVENLKKEDLRIIRNTIYARHGYSFKNRPLRVFFDAQSWYVPVHTDIRGEFTDIERQNIELLLRYEQNAEEYYDSFGRG
ncbi:YARHG domain-containing protein [Pontibacter sp. G13]|uniref:YARHG domain-containing protein n=1 Tax=Pontibacter sp. G13 TaxID=3074898 RepID=UPI00288C1C3A|nr:YARHG domain-containing protein [Pontibacter sp. G13]WNJ17756.1 YARHG domain-containing protein [Pontibacter sp. G13]